MAHGYGARDDFDSRGHVGIYQRAVIEALHTFEAREDEALRVAAADAGGSVSRWRSATARVVLSPAADQRLR